MTNLTKCKKTNSGSARKQSGSGNASSRRLQPERRDQMIAESAYFRARERGFVGGDKVFDWLSAEDEIDRLLLNQF